MSQVVWGSIPGPISSINDSKGPPFMRGRSKQLELRLDHICAEVPAYYPLRKDTTASRSRL